MHLQTLQQMRQTRRRRIYDEWLSQPTRRFTDSVRNIFRYRLELYDITFLYKWSATCGLPRRRDTLQNNIMPEEQSEDLNECDMRKPRRSPFPWPRRFRRLSKRTTARTINATKRTAARDAATITIVEEPSLSSLLLSIPGAEEVTVESVKRGKENND